MFNWIKYERQSYKTVRLIFITIYNIPNIVYIYEQLCDFPSKIYQGGTGGVKGGKSDWYIDIRWIHVHQLIIQRLNDCSNCIHHCGNRQINVEWFSLSANIGTRVSEGKHGGRMVSLSILLAQLHCFKFEYYYLYF